VKPNVKSVDVHPQVSPNGGCLLTLAVRPGPWISTYSAGSSIESERPTFSPTSLQPHNCCATIYGCQMNLVTLAVIGNLRQTAHVRRKLVFCARTARHSSAQGSPVASILVLLVVGLPSLLIYRQGFSSWGTCCAVSTSGVILLQLHNCCVQPRVELEWFCSDFAATT